MKIYQIGIDLMESEDKELYLIENNTNCFLILPNAHHDLNTNKNEEYAIKRYIDSLDPFFKKHNLTTISYNYLSPKYTNLFNAWRERGYGVTKKTSGVKIIYRHNPLTRLIGDKKNLEDNYHWYEKVGVKKIPPSFPYDSSSFPNFLLKPTLGVAGKGIEFYNQRNTIDKPNYVRQGYIKAREQDYLLEWDGQKLNKFSLEGSRIYDIRSLIYISDKGDIIFAGAYKRVSGLPLPTHLPYGKLPNSLTKPFLCNTSQNAYRSFMTLDEEMEYKDISCKIGKVIYDNYIKKGNNKR